MSETSFPFKSTFELIHEMMTMIGIIAIDINDGPDTVRYTDNYGTHHVVSLSREVGE